MRILVTGAAGFIGFSTARRLLEMGYAVAGFDNLNAYYSTALKQARLEILKGYKNFHFLQADLTDAKALADLWQKFKPDHVIHLAAQVGVRHAAKDPAGYVAANLVGFQNIIELVREFQPTNFVYASSSSVYGTNNLPPFREDQDTRSPANFYAATKQSNELVAYCYTHQFNLTCTGLRFFTVYGPYGRPDMAIFKFSERILDGLPIKLHNSGAMTRDFTYVEDIVDGVLAALNRPQKNKIYNLGSGQATSLPKMIETLGTLLGQTPQLEFAPMDSGEVQDTLADVSLAQRDLGYQPHVTLEQGLANFTTWLKDWRRQHGSARLST